MKITKMDVDYVRMLITRVVRYRWDTAEGDLSRVWQFSEFRFDDLPEYARAEAKRRLDKLMARTESVVLFNKPVTNVQLCDQPFVADILHKEEFK